MTQMRADRTGGGDAWRRWAPALGLVSQSLLQSGVIRFVRAGSVSLGLTYAVMMVVVFVHGGTSELDAVAVRGVEVLSWLVALPTTLILARGRASEQLPALRSLAAQRGVGRLDDEVLVTLSGVVVLLRALGPATLFLAMLATVLASDVPVFLGRLGMALGVLLYVVALSCSGGLLARWSARFAPKRGPELLFGIVIGPYLLGMVLPGIPSLPGLFATLLDAASRLGAGAAG